jgi:hypothetical protein
MIKPSNVTNVQTSLRLPGRLHAILLDAANKNCRSLNAEIVARLLMEPADAQLTALFMQGSETQKIVREILDTVTGTGT